MKVEQAAFALAGEGGLEESQRGSGGFGHTGT
jgi:dUTPase